MGFVDPSANLQRTIYETILRGYLFIVKPDEADLYHSNLGTRKEETFLRKRRFYGHSSLREQLFEPATQERHRRFYKELCIPAHAEIKGLFLDFPEYSKKQIDDRFRVLPTATFK